MDSSSLAGDRQADQDSVDAEVHGSPEVPISVIAEALRESHGLEVLTAKPAGGEVDMNVRVDTKSGRFLVKIGAPRSDDEGWRDDILRHVAQVAPELPVPHLIENRLGSGSTPLVHGVEVWHMRVFNWLDGDLLADISPRFELLVDLGRSSAELTEALDTFDDMSMATHPWDLRTAAQTLQDNLPFLRSTQRVDAVRRILRMLHAVQPLLAQSPVATVHHDLNDYNVLVMTDAAGRQRISGILDFNDALRTHRVADVAIAAAYAMLRQSAPIDAAAAVVSGYHSHSPLSDAELELVLPLAAIRLCLNATLWTRRTSALEPEAAKYGRRRMADTWPMVEHISTVDPQWALDRIRRACGLA
ncbi:phosphotransferase [Mycolicibacterium boenickei]